MQSFLHLKIIRIKRETNDANTYFLKEIHGKEIVFKPGQFLTFSLNIDGEEVKRTFSIITTNHDLPEIGITIKNSEKGFASGFLLANLKIGDILRALHPMGEFTLYPIQNGKREIHLIGAGSGITPLYSLLRSVLKTEPVSKVFLYYGNRNENSIIYKNELEKLESKYSERFKVYHFLTQPQSDWKGLKGRISKEKLLEIFNELPPDKEAHFYLCGPKDLMYMVMDLLKSLQIRPNRVHQEYYQISILQNADISEEEIKTRVVTIIFEDQEHVITVNPEFSILESALNQGLYLPNSCQIGQCTSCRAKLLSGKLNLVDQIALSDDDIKKGYCLTCVGFPLSDDVVIDYKEN